MTFECARNRQSAEENPVSGAAAEEAPRALSGGAEKRSQVKSSGIKAGCRLFAFEARPALGAGESGLGRSRCRVF